MSNNQHEPTTAEIRKQAFNFNWNNYPEFNECDADWLQETMITLLDRLEAAEARDVVTPEYLDDWIQRTNKAEATIKAVSDLISKRKFSYDERTERSGDMGALFGEIEGVVWAV